MLKPSHRMRELENRLPRRLLITRSIAPGTSSPTRIAASVTRGVYPTTRCSNSPTIPVSAQTRRRLNLPDSRNCLLFVRLHGSFHLYRKRHADRLRGKQDVMRIICTFSHKAPVATGPPCAPPAQSEALPCYLLYKHPSSCLRGRFART